MEFDLNFYKGKRVLVTGHTGFKGAWLCRLLHNLGADVTGYSLRPNTSPSLFELMDGKRFCHSVIGDVRDYDHLMRTFMEVKPEIVLHLAVQPIVRDSYKEPRYTYETNVMGTVNVMECLRQCTSVRSFLNVTTDKVYLNREWAWGYREDEMLDGFDPYSNSKSTYSVKMKTVILKAFHPATDCVDDVVHSATWPVQKSWYGETCDALRNKQTGAHPYATVWEICAIHRRGKALVRNQKASRLEKNGFL